MFIVICDWKDAIGHTGGHLFNRTSKQRNRWQRREAQLVTVIHADG